MTSSPTKGGRCSVLKCFTHASIYTRGIDGSRGRGHVGHVHICKLLDKAECKRKVNSKKESANTNRTKYVQFMSYKLSSAILKLELCAITSARICNVPMQ